MMSHGRRRISWTAAGLVLLSLMLGGFMPGFGATSVSAVARPPQPALAGTSWQLVRFLGPDGKAVTPDDRTKYTIEFDAGQLRTRVDCNRGRGTWQSSGGSRIEFGPLALTRARCPDGSLHDQIVKHWTEIRAFALDGGHLRLSLSGDGGTYEFEPSPKK
jgi:para-nitrobenzyl esterase